MDSGSVSGTQRMLLRVTGGSGWRKIGPSSCLRDEDGNFSGRRSCYYMERRPNLIQVIYIDKMKNGQVKIVEEETIEVATWGDQQITDHNHNGTQKDFNFCWC